MTDDPRPRSTAPSATGQAGGDAEALYLLALRAAAASDASRFEALIGHREAARGDGLVVASDVLRRLLRDGRVATVARLAAASDRRSAAWPVLSYYRGCAALARGDRIGARAHFTCFREVVTAPDSRFDPARHPQLNVMYRQGTLVAGSDEVACRRTLAGLDPAAHGHGEEVLRARETAGEGWVIAGLADGRYFDLYAERFVASAMRHLPGATLHLHLVAPGPDSLDVARRLAVRAPTLTVRVEADPPWRHPAFYACDRFFVLPRLLRRYRRGVVMLDIDLEVQSEFGGLLALLEGHDFGCFTSRRWEPASVYQAGVMAAAPTVPAARLLDDLGRFCLPVLADPAARPQFLWMLDQAALFSILVDARARGGDIAFAALDALSGRPLADFARGPDDSEAKHAAWSRSTRDGMASG